MEQPIGQNVTPTTPPAGTDPAFFPGLVPQQSGVPGKTGSTQDAAQDEIPAALKGSAARKPAAKTPESEAEPESGAADESDVREGARAADAGADAEEPAEAQNAEDGDSTDDDADADDGKPAFEASDRRAAITADGRGVTFTLDEETAEFRWDEIGAVEIDTPRFGKRFGVTVYTSSRRWFQCDVEAASRSQLKTWTAELDAVLDARFEDDKPELDEAAGADDAAEDETEPQTEAEVEAETDTKAKDTKAKDPADA